MCQVKIKVPIKSYRSTSDGVRQQIALLAIQRGGGAIDVPRLQTTTLMLSRVTGKNSEIFLQSRMVGLASVPRQKRILLF